MEQLFLVQLEVLIAMVKQFMTQQTILNGEMQLMLQTLHWNQVSGH